MSDEPTRRRPTAEAITEVVAERVRALRDGQGMSQEELAEALNELGVPWKRATVVNLETRAPGSRGKGPGRDSVTLGEFLALALALKVPPPLLIADPRHVAEVAVAKGMSAPAWEILMWLVGAKADKVSSRADLDALAVTWCGWEIFEATLQLDYRERRSPGASSGDLFAADSRDDARHRGELRRISSSLEKLREIGSSWPVLPQSVLKRAAELDVELPSEHWN